LSKILPKEDDDEEKLLGGKVKLQQKKSFQKSIKKRPVKNAKKVVKTKRQKSIKM
jgi:hypothetical protein